MWAADIGAQVAAGKIVMVFYQFRVEDKHNRWPSMKQMMQIICDVGGIDMVTGTVMHFGGMYGVEKKRILSDIKTH